MSKDNQSTIAQNRKARHDYFVQDTVEAGLQLEGWEVKSLRAGKGQLVDSYVIFKDGEAYLFGAQIQPLMTACTHVPTDPLRTRKLLMNRKEIDKLIASVEQKGFTCVALELYWKQHIVKCRIGLAKGKKAHDKRDVEKERDAAREIQAISKSKRYA
jgi:SsrA-binding protein